MNGSVAGFWSYAHVDNACAQNRILRLAELVRDEYSLATGRDLTLFMDRTDNRWADEWRDRVENGLDAATFFVPIITPRYLRQPECRRELLDFVTRARNLGIAETVLPIVYTHTRELDDPTTPDEAAALVRRMRREKWHDLRTDNETSVAHRRAVSRLVARLVEIPPLRYNGSRPGHGSPRTLDVVSALEEAVPRWGDAFGMMDSAMARIDTLTEKVLLEMEHAHFDEDSAIGRLAVLRTYAD
ncbi:MAG TPA: toll/interleukin-1 receptor domain-containing protein, partial [Pseudonocardiaceae bacterium]